MISRILNLGGKAAPPEPVAAEGELARQWEATRHVYPVYTALAKQFERDLPPGGEAELPPARPTREVSERVRRWLDEMDDRIQAVHLRQLPPSALNASEESLRAFIQRQLRKPEKTNVDRDKIDFLLAQYFALCAPEELYQQKIELADVASVLHPVLAEADPTPLEWCEPLERILQSVAQCHSLRDMMERGLLEQGRLLKESAGCMFYDPAALVAFCRFNFVMRRAFVRLLHEDLKGVAHALGALEEHGVRSVDCRRAGFTAAEPTARLRQFAEEWRPPFHKDYSESSVSRCFEQLLALRTDLEEAAERVQTSASNRDGAAAPTDTTSPAQIIPASQVEEAAPAPDTAALSAEAQGEPGETSSAKSLGPTEHAASRAETTRAPEASPLSKRSDVRAAAGSAVGSGTPPQAEECLERIWEQLIAAPPVRGRSMATVVLENTKVLLSSWEVAAFVSGSGQDSEDLRRAVVARALVALTMENRKRTGDVTALEEALGFARAELSHFQLLIEQYKSAKKTEAAVNLGISAKRLLSMIEEGEQHRP